MRIATRWRWAVGFLRDAVGGEVRATLVTAEPLDLLSLRPDAIVVREGDRLIRYTLSPP